MKYLSVNFNQVVTEKELSLASNFSFQVNTSVIDSLMDCISGFLFDYSIKNKLQYNRDITWLDEGWEILQIGNEMFKLGVHLDQERPYLVISLSDYPAATDSRFKKCSLVIRTEGKFKGLRLKISTKINVDCDFICETLVEKTELAYANALIDFEAMLRDFCVASSGDDFYDVLRKSSMNTLVQKEVSLYCVYDGMGRHIPSVKRVMNIASIIAKGIPSYDLDPIRLAMDFFLTPLDGKKFELYTQKAFRENRALTANKNNYTGTSYVRIATEAFFKNADVTVQPIIKVNDDNWLLSAIYPSRLQPFVHFEIENQKEEFLNVATKLQNRNRSALDKLKKLSRNDSKGKIKASSMGEFLGAFVSAFLNK